MATILAQLNSFDLNISTGLRNRSIKVERVGLYLDYCNRSCLALFCLNLLRSLARSLSHNIFHTLTFCVVSRRMSTFYLSMEYEQYFALFLDSLSRVIKNYCYLRLLFKASQSLCTSIFKNPQQQHKHVFKLFLFSFTAYLIRHNLPQALSIPSRATFTPPQVLKTLTTLLLPCSILGFLLQPFHPSYTVLHTCTTTVHHTPSTTLPTTHHVFRPHQLLVSSCSHRHPRLCLQNDAQDGTRAQLDAA